MKIVLIIIGALLIISYIRFRFNHSMDLKMVKFLELKCKLLPGDVSPMLSLASAYTTAELYAKAHALYLSIKKSPDLMDALNQNLKDKLEENIIFCEKPLPWSKKAKDHHAFKYTHYFFLKRIGRRRYNFITEEDALEFNSYMRQQK